MATLQRAFEGKYRPKQTNGAILISDSATCRYDNEIDKNETLPSKSKHTDMSFELLLI